MSVLFIKRGMSLIEVLVTLSIIVLLAVCLFPAIRHSLRQKENLETATRIRQALSAFEMYATEKGGYPPDKNPAQVPPEMAEYYFPYFKIDWWCEETPLGGKWDWDNGYNYAYSVSIHAPDRSLKQLTEFDAMVDDGDLNTGNFRQRGNHYHFILQEED